MNKIMSMFLKCLTAVLMVFGLSGHAAATACLSNIATFSGSIGAQTSCADHSMDGCVIGTGGTTCTYTGTTCDFQVDVPAAVGQSSDKTTTFSVTNPGFGNPTCQVKETFTQGNQGSNYCQYIYPSGVSGDTLTTQNSRGNVYHKQLEVCTDEVLVILAPPVVRLSKTVVRVVDGDFECSEATDSLDVIAPTEVAYCYEISNEGQSDIDGLVLVDDNGTPDDFSDDTEINDIGSLAGGTTVTPTPSVVVTVTEAGEVVNTAIVDGLFDGAECDTCSDSDTARLNVAVACDDDTQNIANETGQVTTARDAEGTTRCSPAQDNVGTRSTSMLCDSSCVLRTGCTGLDTASCLQPCVPSGNWTYLSGDSSTGACMAGEPSPGNLPLCQEVLGNPNNNPDCGVIHNPSLLRSDGHGNAFSSNPLLYYFPSSGGGDSTGTIYCILLAGETADVCPSGAFVY